MIWSWLKIMGLGFIQDRLIFKPQRFDDPILSPDLYGLRDVTDVRLESELNVTIHAWHHAPRGADQPTFLFFHGNSGHMGCVTKPEVNEVYHSDYRIRLLKAIEAAGCGYVAVSLRGFGQSSGVPSEQGFCKDVDAVLDYMLNTERMDMSQVVVLGESLGATVAMRAAAELAERKYPAAMVASIAPFYSMLEKVYELHPDLVGSKVEEKLRHPLHTANEMERIGKQTFIYLMHPEHDDVTAPYHSERLAQIAELKGFRYLHEVLPDVGHITWDAVDVTARILRAYTAHLPK